MTSWYIWKHDVKYKFDIVVLHGIFLVFKFDKTPRNTKNEYRDQNKMAWFWMWACVKNILLIWEVQICYWFHDYYGHWIFH